MAGSECDYCKRDISKPSLVRCSSERCPLKVSRAGAVRGVLLGIGGIGLVVAFLIVGGAWLMSPGKPRGAGDVRAQGDAASSATSSSSGGQQTRAMELSGSIRNWGGLFGGGHGDAQQTPVAVADANADRPDPRAASRVQTFSCSGTLSASRSLICTNWDLATTDYNLALTYNAVLARSRHPDALRRAHDAFLAGLDTVGNDAARLREYYRLWQEQLTRG
jgi:hypothetical protein